MRKLFLLTITIFAYSFLHARTTIPSYLQDETLLYKDVELQLKNSFVFIPGGTYKQIGAEGKSMTSMVTLSDFYMQKTEVTNRWYKVFLIDLAKKDLNRAVEMLPDTACWTKDFTYSYNEPMDLLYFVHRAYDDYPVVGVTYYQAKAFTDWANEKLEIFFKSKSIKGMPVQLHLPTQSEWQYAASGGLENNLYGYKVTDENFATNGNMNLFNTKTRKYRANHKTDEGNFIADRAFHTAAVGSYESNKYSLKDMVGNVSEWTGDKYYQVVLDSSIKDLQKFYASADSIPTDLYIVKGGSWVDDYKKQRINNIYEYQPNATHSFIGFRLAAYVK